MVVQCVIALYEKRPVHTKIQSFRLCMDHKISPIKSKIYKGYGALVIAMDRMWRP